MYTYVCKYDSMKCDANLLVKDLKVYVIVV